MKGPPVPQPVNMFLLFLLHIRYLADKPHSYDVGGIYSTVCEPEQHLLLQVPCGVVLRENKDFKREITILNMHSDLNSTHSGALWFVGMPDDAGACS